MRIDDPLLSCLTANPLGPRLAGPTAPYFFSSALALAWSSLTRARVWSGFFRA